jgi:hypothetical protein
MVTIQFLQDNPLFSSLTDITHTLEWFRQGNEGFVIELRREMLNTTTQL